jgi:hypothetical protein
LIDGEQREIHIAAAAIAEWALDSFLDPDKLPTEIIYSPEVAQVLIANMMERYEWLAEWVVAADRLVGASAQFKLANDLDLSISSMIDLRAALAEALDTYQKQRPPNQDSPEKVIRAYVQLNRIAGADPEKRLETSSEA